MCNRKKVLIISILTGIVILLAACQPSVKESSSGTVVAPPVEKIVWKSSGHGPATDPSQIFHDKCCEAITVASGGRLVVKPFVGGSIVPAYKELDAINEGVPTDGIYLSNVQSRQMACSWTYQL